MTDKQIIIDGVDVSGCKHYKNRTCIADYCLTDMPFGEAKCELNPNCYYKQLKRKEQECDMWKNLTVDNGAVALKYQQQLDQLKGIIKKYEECNKYLVEENGKTYTRLEYKLLKALTEIKEMLKEICMEECLFDWNKTSKKHCGDCDCRYGQILQKISECEVKNDFK